VAFAIAMFRRPFARMLEGVSRRVAKLSIFDVSIELVSVTTRPLSFADINIPIDDLAHGNFTTTTITDLVDRIRQDGPPYFLVVDIGDGRRWLISRLLLFTFVLWRIGAVRCVVFVETSGECTQRLLGVATPELICAKLGGKYPWLDRALVAAWSDKKTSFQREDERNVDSPYYNGMLSLLVMPLSKPEAQTLINRFVASPIIRQSKQEAGWEPVKGISTWEHTTWLTRDRIYEDLRGIFLLRDESCLVDTPDRPTGERNKALLRRKSPFVALVNERGELKQLVDRRALMDALADNLRSEKEDG
jgi:hypothetical protein